MTDPEATVELRFRASAECVAVLDAVVQATPGADRTTYLLQMLSQWCAHEVHKASLVSNVLSRNGSTAASRRRFGGTTAALPAGAALSDKAGV